jgi:hypothetical protein
MTLQELVEWIVSHAIDQNATTNEERFTVVVDLSQVCAAEHMYLGFAIGSSTQLQEAGLQLASIETNGCNFTRLQ